MISPRSPFGVPFQPVSNILSGYKFTCSVICQFGDAIHCKPLINRRGLTPSRHIYSAALEDEFVRLDVLDCQIASVTDVSDEERATHAPFVSASRSTKIAFAPGATRQKLIYSFKKHSDLSVIQRKQRH